MDPLLQIDNYIKQSIEHSLGLPVPDETLRLKLLASEESSSRLRNKLFFLEDRIHELQMRLEQSKAEAAMNAQGLRRCVEEKEAMAVRCAELGSRCSRLERECALYDRDVERLMDSCDELAKENEELKARLMDASYAKIMVAEIESLKKDKEKLRINLVRAEEEVKVLSEENVQLDRDNEKLCRKLKKVMNHRGLNETRSASPSAKGKHRSCQRQRNTLESTDNLDGTGDSSREPLSPLQQNSAGNSSKNKK